MAWAISGAGAGVGTTAVGTVASAVFPARPLRLRARSSAASALEQIEEILGDLGPAA